MISKIDVHTHYLPPAYTEMLRRRNLTLLDGGVPVPTWNMDMQLSLMDRLSVSTSLLSISSPHLHMGEPAEAIETARAANEYGSDLKKKYPGKIGIMASLPLPETEASIQEIQYCRDQLSLDGFALMTNSNGIYLGNPLLDPVMEKLDQINAVVIIHPTQPSALPEGISEQLIYPAMEFFFDTTRAVANMLLNHIFSRYPHIRWIIPHAGAFLPILSDRLSAVTKIFGESCSSIEQDLSGLYYDLAGFSMPKQLEILRKVTSDTHLLYGSDSTFTPADSCEILKKEMDAHLNKELQTLVYQENARQLFPQFYSA